MVSGGARLGAGRPKGAGKYGEETKPVRIPKSLELQVLKFVKNKGYLRPFYGCSVEAGFPSPADDHLADKLDLNEYLIKHPAATFFLRVTGDSMMGAGIHHGDILVVDRSLEPTHGKIVIAAVDGQLTVKRLIFKGPKRFLAPENDAFKAHEITDEQDIVIWGVVSSVVHKV